MKKFHKFTQNDNKVWQKLFDRQMNNLQGKASKLFWKGIEDLKLDNNIPDFQKLEEDLLRNSQCTLINTDIQYLPSDLWFKNVSQKIFPITRYIRKMENLDYTPLPDAFHDTFGHLPFLADIEFANIAQKFGLKFLKSNDEKKLEIEKLWWFTFEFGLIKENNEVKIFGGGIASSFGETQNVFSGKVKHSPFIKENVVKAEATADKMHEELFVLNSLNQIDKILDEY